MNAHDRALELAVARVDFALTAPERESLRRHLDACGQCRLDVEGVTGDARRLASRPAHRLAPERAAVMRLSLERPRHARSPALVFVVAALLVLLSIAAAAVGAEVIRRLDESRLAVVPAPTPGPSAEPSTSGATWSQWPLPPVDAELGRWDISVAGAPRAFVAAGGPRAVVAELRQCQLDPISRDLVDCRIGVWGYEQDGWRAAKGDGLAVSNAISTSGPEVMATGVAISDDRVVIIGHDSPAGSQRIQAGIWVAGPDLVFQRATIEGTLDADLTAVAVTRTGFVATGVVHDATPRAAFWTSPDGVSWARVPDQQALDIGGYFDTMETPSHGGPSQLVVSPDRIVALGTTCDERGEHCRPVSWMSRAGVAWQRGTQMAQEWRPVSAAWASGVFDAIAGPWGEESDMCLITSTDGLAWRQLYPGGCENMGYGVGTAAMLATDIAFVVVGAVDSEYPPVLDWNLTPVPGTVPWREWLPTAPGGYLPTTGPGYRVHLVRLVDTVLLVAIGNADPTEPVMFVEGPLPPR